MGFTVPAVHYSALATLPPGLTTSKSQQSFKHTTTIQFKLNQIFKKFINNDIHNQLIAPSKPVLQSPETIEKENDNLLTVVKNPNNNNSGNRTLTGQESPKFGSSLMEPLERLPFTEPYVSIPTKKDKFPLELSAYHKHCIHQQKYIAQKQYHHEPSSSLSQANPSSTKAYRPNYQLQKSIDRSAQIQTNNKASNSNTTLPLSTSIENHIGFQYASQRNTITSSHGLRSSYTQSQTQHLRRLQSKSRIRPIPSEIKTSFPSSSIAHRIELLKQSMHNNQPEFHQYKSEIKTPPIIDSIHKQTQTNNNPSKSSEIHHIHHHHIHSSSYLSIQWRTYLSIIGTLLIIFVFLIEFITIIF